MHTLGCEVAALAVAWIFYTWRSYQGYVTLKQRTLRERVAYMLWVCASAIRE
jgi:hypothetical protein